MSRIAVRASLYAIALYTLTGCVAAPPPAPTPPAITQAQADSILAELRDIKRMVAEQKPKAADDPQRVVKLAPVAENVLGSPAAPVTLVEFTDFQCPFCKRFHDRTWPQIKQNYVDTGKVRYVVRDMPLSFHEAARPSAMAARCAGRQGKYWELREALFATQGELTATSIRAAVAKLGLDSKAFEACVLDPKVAALVDADADEAERIGVNGTPGFVLAKPVADGLEGTLVLGAQPYAVFASRLDALLGKPAP